MDLSKYLCNFGAENSEAYGWEGRKVIRGEGIDDVTYDNSDYDSYREAYEEEQVAYDDFIASMDMDD